MDGVDYSFGHPGGAALRAAGKTFACRYLSHTASKNLTPSETADLAAHDVAAVVVWETTASRAAASRAAGTADATEAAAQAKACGQPADRPIYFAVDWNADPTLVVPYFQGVASVLGVARTGAYGGIKVVRYLLDHGLIRWAWQTAAWSAGAWEPRAHIRQYAKTITINGVACDLDTAMQDDFGQWTPGHSPITEDIVTPAEIDAVATAAAKKTLAALGAPAGVLAAIDNPTVADDPKNPSADDESLRAMWWDTGMHAGRADANSAAVLAQLKQGVPLSLTDDQVTSLATKLAANPTFASTLAHAIGSDFAARLQS
ncbi:glycoside hydrolase domain-containing protein [Streptomyces sp. V4-01]|uniref:Glycoside hydrolase domain-containing protein n=1 Tax=Actinacidiphila polyblastidii TaxID=3110430 RepID=A0ABU7PKT7_9ACTN|nr:glycoside hydrolase domain-containing protein [Streptomyces sp. V4-01]